jgi:uncharacterized protein
MSIERRARRAATMLLGVTLLALPPAAPALAAPTGAGSASAGSASAGAASAGAASAGSVGAGSVGLGSAGSVPGSRACPPSGVALGFSDALDKVVRGGATLGGLSSLAFDRRAGAWVSTVDNHGTDPARLWFFRDLGDPTVVRDPLVLRRPDGTPYDGTTSDNEGLVVLPDGDYLVSSETEPSIRIFGRDGVQKAALPVPARFAVTPAGEASVNATLEGLTILPSGREIIAAMEGALSGDVSAGGDATLHRFLVYAADRPGSWRLTRQLAYRTEPGNRVPEILAYTNDKLVVEEAAFSAAVGNSVSLYAVTGLHRAADVTAIPNLSQAPANVVLGKRLVADLVRCPTLDAPAKQPQTNPLLDNYEGLALTGRAFGFTGLSLIVDDNFNPSEITRVLNLAARLP